MSASHRFAIVWDLDEYPTEPCGLLIDHGEKGVRLRLPGDGWGLKEWFTEPFRELQPDATDKVTKPGDPDYFEATLAALSRTFAFTIPEVSDTA